MSLTLFPYANCADNYSCSDKLHKHMSCVVLRSMELRKWIGQGNESRLIWFWFNGFFFKYWNYCNEICFQIIFYRYDLWLYFQTFQSQIGNLDRLTKNILKQRSFCHLILSRNLKCYSYNFFNYKSSNSRIF